LDGAGLGGGEVTEPDKAEVRSDLDSGEESDQVWQQVEVPWDGLCPVHCIKSHM
jgi:hypothetical protein